MGAFSNRKATTPPPARRTPEERQYAMNPQSVRFRDLETDVRHGLKLRHKRTRETGFGTEYDGAAPGGPIVRFVAGGWGRWVDARMLEVA